MRGLVIVDQSLFSRWPNEISLSRARLTAITRKSVVTLPNKTSAVWWSVKPRRERCKNSPGKMTNRAAEITPTQRLNNSLPIKYTGMSVRVPRIAGM